MPSRKQRRRRQKARRHEYEYVYVDEEGREVEPPPEEEQRRPARGDKATRNGKKDRSLLGKRPLREYQPPSWRRSARRALLFFPLFFLVFSLVNRHASIPSRVLYSFAYSLLFVPLTYMMDRTAYRAFLRRSGRTPDAKRR
jgi:hypothetical protein